MGQDFLDRDSMFAVKEFLGGTFSRSDLLSLSVLSSLYLGLSTFLLLTPVRNE